MAMRQQVLLLIVLFVVGTVCSFISTIGKKCEFGNLKDDNETITICFERLSADSNNNDDWRSPSSRRIRTFGAHFFLYEFMSQAYGESDILVNKGCTEYDTTWRPDYQNGDDFELIMGNDWAAKIAWACQIATCIIAGLVTMASLFILCCDESNFLAGRGAGGCMVFFGILAFVSQTLAFLFFTNEICSACGCAMSSGAILAVIASSIYLLVALLGCCLVCLYPIFGDTRTRTTTTSRSRIEPCTTDTNTGSLDDHRYPATSLSCSNHRNDCIAEHDRMRRDEDRLNMRLQQESQQAYQAERARQDDQERWQRQQAMFDMQFNAGHTL